MKYDVFFSLSQSSVAGQLPSAKDVFSSFFDQLKLADDLDYETAWFSESHLSWQTQKKTSFRISPHFSGEFCLNTDVLQLMQLAYEQTKKIKLGSATRNITSRGGPIAQAELLKAFLNFKQLSKHAERGFEFGFGSGDFDFENAPYGVRPRTEWEMESWRAIKPKILEEAAEIFMRLLGTDEVSSAMISPKFLNKVDFKVEGDWERVSLLAKKSGDFESGEIRIKKFFDFEILSTLPLDVDLSKVQLAVESQAEILQKICNNFFPTGSLDLKNSEPREIEESHLRMGCVYNEEGGAWRRWYLPRLVNVFLDDTKGFSTEQKNEKAKLKARAAWVNHWEQLGDGAADLPKIEKSMELSIYGSPEAVAEKLSFKFHPHDRLILCFNFNSHDNEDVKKSMRIFKEKVSLLVEEYGK